MVLGTIATIIPIKIRATPEITVDLYTIFFGGWEVRSVLMGGLSTDGDDEIPVWGDSKD